MVQIPIISMVTTAVLVPTWHAVHGIGTLTHLCVSGDVVVCDGCVCDRKRYVHVVWFVEGCMHHKWVRRDSYIMTMPTRVECVRP